MTQKIRNFPTKIVNYGKLFSKLHVSIYKFLVFSSQMSERQSEAKVSKVQRKITQFESPPLVLSQSKDYHESKTNCDTQENIFIGKQEHFLRRLLMPRRYLILWHESWEWVLSAGFSPWNTINATYIFSRKEKHNLWSFLGVRSEKLCCDECFKKNPRQKKGKERNLNLKDFLITENILSSLRERVHCIRVKSEENFWQSFDGFKNKEIRNYFKHDQEINLTHMKLFNNKVEMVFFKSWQVLKSDF